MRPLEPVPAILLTAVCQGGEAWAVCRFCRLFLQEHSRKPGLLFFGCFLAGRLVLILASWSLPLPYVILAFGDHALLTGLVMAFFSAPSAKKLFAASVLFTIFTVFGEFCASFVSIFALAYLHLVKRIPEPVLTGRWNSLTAAVSFLGVVWGLHGILRGNAKECSGEKPGKWYLTAVLPLVMATALTDAANWCASRGILLRGEGNLYQAQLFGHGGICLLTALSLIGSGFCLFGMDRIYEEQKKSGRYECRLMAYQMTAEQYRQAERLRHDLKNHVIALQGLLEQKDWAAMNRYLEAMEGMGGFARGEEATGSPVLDAILLRKRKEAEALGIRWECSVKLPANSAVWEFDLCVLFGNLLDNAIAACGQVKGRKGRFLCVQARMVKRCFFLEVKNSFSPEREKHASRREPDREGRRGIGLLNVRDVVGAYHGTMEVEKKEGMFVNTVLLPERTRGEEADSPGISVYDTEGDS
ncbi:MAG: GHKL domain-containing protein [Lachnospiraceae bacterium]|jgi:hypothetical protein|nr:GHKL domain-containing protein [Lachnospiraceae bacterium]